MRVTIFHAGCYPVPPILGGGVEKAWFELATSIADQAHEVTILSRSFPGLPPSERRGNLTLQRRGGYDRPASFLHLLIQEWLYVWQWLPLLPPADILVLHSIWAPIMFRKPRFGQQYIHVARFPKGQLRFYGRGRVFQAPSQAVATAIAAERIPTSARISTIGYPISVPQQIATFQSRSPSFLYVGRVHPEKGLELLCQAYGEYARQTLNPWPLSIVGPVEASHGGGGQQYLALLRSIVGSQEHIRFKGPEFNSQKLSQLYADARVFLYPSIADTGETFGIAPLEAMAHGCVPIVSNLACFRDFIVPDQNGLSFNHRSAESARDLATLLSTCSHGGIDLERMSTLARATAEGFASPIITRKFLSDFEELLSV